MSSEAAIWHDLECGGYEADLELWLDLAWVFGGPVLDLGAGTGRVSLALARAGHRVHAVELDRELADELAARAQGLAVSVQCGDACAFRVSERFPLCVVPMQTVHLLEDRGAFLRCAHDALAVDGVLAVALLGPGLVEFDFELEGDRAQADGRVYEIRPTLVRREPAGLRMEWLRERSDADGSQTATRRLVLAAINGPGLVAEAAEAGFAHLATRIVPDTHEYAGSEIVILRRLS